ncbi:hypothetical protein KW783_02525 [Candidatus Parcubacteria bacterium]|nr:hypothetical protein [Candidatus Parcubacteria bacterium]
MGGFFLHSGIVEVTLRKKLLKGVIMRTWLVIGFFGDGTASLLTRKTSTQRFALTHAIENICQVLVEKVEKPVMIYAAVDENSEHLPSAIKDCLRLHGVPEDKIGLETEKILKSRARNAPILTTTFIGDL